MTVTRAIRYPLAGVMSISPRKPASVKSMLMKPILSSKSSEPHTAAAKRGLLLSSKLAPAFRCSGPK